MNQPLVSIIVPFYNCEKHVSLCVRSLTLQLLSNVELIFVNDGSTDSTGVLLDEAAKADSRIKVIHKSNGGPGSARALGIKAATCQYIGFADADDKISPELYSTLYAHANQYGADIAICGFYNVIDELTHPTEDEGIKLLGGKALITGDETGNIINLILEERLFASLWNRLYSRQFLLINNIAMPTDIRLHEDMLFNILALKYAKKIAVVDKPLYYYHIGDNSSVSKKYNSSLFDEIERLSTRLLISCTTSYHDKINLLTFKRIIYALRVCINSDNQDVNNECNRILKSSFNRKFLKKISYSILYEAHSGYDRYIKNILLLFAIKMHMLFLLKIVLKD